MMLKLLLFELSWSRKTNTSIIRYHYFKINIISNNCTHVIKHFLKISSPDTFQIKLQITKIMGSYTNLHVHAHMHSLSCQQ